MMDRCVASVCNLVRKRFLQVGAGIVDACDSHSPVMSKARLITAVNAQTFFLPSASHCYSKNTLFFPTNDLPLPVVQQLCTVQIAQCLKKKKGSIEIFPQDEFI